LVLDVPDRAARIPSERVSDGIIARVALRRLRQINCHSFWAAGTHPVMDSFQTMTDIELLRAARVDPEAFGAFYRRHAVAVEHWIRRQTPDPGTAADLTGETFAQALVSLSKFRGSTDEAARGWLYGIARNLVRRYHRRGRVELAMCAKLGIGMELDSDELADLNGELDAATAGPALERALDSLPDTQREALELRVIDGLDYREAAAQMGTSEQNARIRVSRALRALSTRLQGAPR
jgi:RNA polymerase sigma factor (sigma-70 family)